MNSFEDMFGDYDPKTHAHRSSISLQSLREARQKKDEQNKLEESVPDWYHVKIPKVSKIIIQNKDYME